MGIEVLPTLPAAVQPRAGERKAAEQRELEHRAAIIQSISPASLAGHPALLAVRQLVGRADGHGGSDKQCRSDEAPRDLRAVGLEAQHERAD